MALATLAGVGAPDGPGDQQHGHREQPQPQQRPGDPEERVADCEGENEDERDGEDGVPAPVPGMFGRCRSPCFRQVVEQATKVGAGLGVHGPGHSLVELGLVQAAVSEVLGQAVGDRLPLGVGNPHVLIGIGAGEQRRETAGPGLAVLRRHDDVPRLV